MRIKAEALRGPVGTLPFTRYMVWKIGNLNGVKLLLLSGNGNGRRGEEEESANPSLCAYVP
jgi:hypothetical protein